MQPIVLETGIMHIDGEERLVAFAWRIVKRCGVARDHMTLKV